MAKIERVRNIGEVPEYRGLRGRIRKQRFVGTGDLNDLVASTDEYLVQYSAKKSYWHGINIVALRTEEEQRGLPPRAGVATVDLAEQVLGIALAEQAKNAADHWPLATASEACLALHVAGRPIVEDGEAENVVYGLLGSEVFAG